MSKHKHNYTQYSEKKQHNQNANPVEKPAITEEVLKPISKTPEVKMDSAPVLVDTPNVAPPKPQLVQETVETKALPETVVGMVVGCAKLNVRAEASLFSDVICTLNTQSEIEINIEKSDKDWFYICTATGVEGYCMRKYVEAHL